MNRSSDTPASASVTIDDIRDPTATNAGIEMLEHDAVQLQSLPLRARRVIVRLAPATVVRYSSNLRVRTHTRLHDDLLAYVAFGPQARGTVNGIAIRPGLMLLAGPAAEVSFVVEAGWESVTLLMPAQDFRSHLAARRRDADVGLAPSVEVLQADAGKVRALYDWGKRLTDTAARNPERFREHGRARRAAQGELLEKLIATLGDARDFQSDRSDRTRQTHSRIVQVAEEYAVARIGDRIYVSDLCRAAAVSERTLEGAFKTVMGLAPVAYLSRLRLHRARQALIGARKGSTTVSAIALDAGFWHFGDFARAYKACFGERPSDTLRGATEPR